MSIAFWEIDEQLLDVIAAEHGRRTEDVYLEWMREVNQQQTSQLARMGQRADFRSYDPSEDPLADLLGAFQSGVPDLGRRHDKYLGQSYLDPHDSCH